MFILSFCTAIIGLIILAPFLACSGTLGYPGVSAASAADMLDSNKGIASPNPRFTDNSNGTVTDNLTGLVWLQNPSVSIIVGHFPCNNLV